MFYFSIRNERFGIVMLDKVLRAGGVTSRRSAVMITAEVKHQAQTAPITKGSR
jgi:hypothetical protein